MCDLLLGDELVIDIDNGSEGHPRREEQKIQVIGIDDSGPTPSVLCYVPAYSCIKRTFKINKKHALFFNLPQKFLGEEGMFITSDDIVLSVKHAPEGELCDNCGTFIQYAKRGEGPVVCRLCLQNPYR